MRHYSLADTQEAFSLGIQAAALVSLADRLALAKVIAQARAMGIMVDESDFEEAMALTEHARNLAESIHKMTESSNNP